VVLRLLSLTRTGAVAGTRATFSIPDRSPSGRAIMTPLRRGCCARAASG